MFTIILMNGLRYDVTPQERDALLGKSGMVFLPRLNLTINTTSISVIEPKGLGKIIDRNKQTEAVLHDGTRVIKQFGRWYCADSERDENGRLITEPDPEYYPETIEGLFLPTPEEYEKDFKQLTQTEYLKKLMSDPERPFELAERKSNLLADDYGHI